jgi:hypothetical protein
MGRDIDERRFPVHAVDFLAAAGVTGGVWNIPSWGGYVLWRLYPEARTLVDGRGNIDPATVADIQFVYEQRWVPGNGPRVEEAYSRHDGIDVVLVQAPAFPEGFTPREWKRVYGSEQAEIFLRDTPRNAANFEGVDRLWEAIEARKAQPRRE